MGQKVGGTCYVSVEGAQLSVSGSVEVPLAKVTRESFRHSTGTGFTEKEITPYVKVEVVDDGSLDLDTLRNNTDMTITAELANGRVYVLSGGYLVSEAALKGDEGKVELEFHGDEGDFQ